MAEERSEASFSEISYTEESLQKSIRKKSGRIGFKQLDAKSPSEKESQHQPILYSGIRM
jgi:hypothetical protein